MKKATAAEVVPTKPGTPFAGGIYVARYFEGTEARALIVAPKNAGELLGHTHADALKQAKACRIAQHKDWRLPRRLEALLLWQNRKALPKGETFEEAWYWTAEKYERGSAYAWIQSFLTGYQGGGHRYDHYLYRARFVRSVAI